MGCGGLKRRATKIKEGVVKKLLVIAVGIVLLFSGYAYADITDSAEIYTYTIVNDAATKSMTSISTSIIVPGRDMIVGWQIMPAASRAGTLAYENIATLYDESTTSGVLQEVIGEVECVQFYHTAFAFLFPREIINGIRVRQGAYTIVIIYFIRG